MPVEVAIAERVCKGTASDLFAEFVAGVLDILSLLLLLSLMFVSLPTSMARDASFVDWLLFFFLVFFFTEALGSPAGGWLICATVAPFVIGCDETLSWLGFCFLPVVLACNFF